MRWIAGLTTALLLAAAPAFAQYEVVQGFDDLPPKGPGTALGIVIWNHGLHGAADVGRLPPPTYVRSLHAAGWDVIRIKRDGLSEQGGWANSGLRHVARTVEEVENAKKQGYARVVLAGQSYGGAITLEAARRTAVYAIVPSAPGTGIRLTDIGSKTASTAGTAQLYEALAEGKFERAVTILPVDDEYALANPERGQRSREILAKRNIPFLPLDDRSTILVGHSASGTPAMAALYAKCLVAFLDPAASPAGMARCGAAGLPPSVDLLDDIATLKPAAMPTGEWWKPYEGVWVGAWNDPMLIALAVEKTATGYDLVYLRGGRDGTVASTKTAATWRAPAKLDGRNVVGEFPTQTITLEFNASARQVFLKWANPQGRSGTLQLRAYAPREPGS